MGSRTTQLGKGTPFGRFHGNDRESPGNGRDPAGGGNFLNDNNTENEEEKPYLKVTEDVGELRFENDDRLYRVRGFNRDGFEKIVQMSLETEGRAFPDSFSHISRRR